MVVQEATLEQRDGHVGPGSLVPGISNAITRGAGDLIKHAMGCRFTIALIPRELSAATNANGLCAQCQLNSGAVADVQGARVIFPQTRLVSRSRSLSRLVQACWQRSPFRSY